LASQHGKEIDTLFTVTLIVTGIVFVLVQSFLAFLVFKFAGSEKRRAIHFTENRTLELVWTIVPAVILTMLIFFGGRLWSRIQLSEPPEDAFEVEVWGEQFRWTFRYPGKDGKFGRTDLKLVSVENPLGIDKNDPASKDDIFFFAGEENLHHSRQQTCGRLLALKGCHSQFLCPSLSGQTRCSPRDGHEDMVHPDKER